MGWKRFHMDLKALVDYGYALEKSDLDSKRIENGRQNETINYTGRQPKEKPRGRTRQRQKQPRNPHHDVNTEKPLQNFCLKW